METSPDNLSERVLQIENRNKKVELDKAWETSLVRKASVAIFTYLSILLYFLAIKIDKPFINAVVPTLGFLLSTLSLPWIRKYWENHRS